LFWAKRDAQKVADLAALAGAQRLELCTSDNSDNSAARQSALTQNRFAGSLEIRCGNWNVTRATEGHFSPAVDAANQRNAVRVITRRAVLPFFGQNSSLPTVTAQAVARRAEPTAVFSVGSQLLRINGNTPLGNVLKLVGADLDKTTLLGYDGLAQAHITPN
ncbi:TadG family pilus assembly protein, partial [Klebsiella pneumoniae]